jgi:hypothetical protein
VVVPSDAAIGATDIAALSIVSGGSGAQVDVAELTTVVSAVVNWEYLYLPLVLR